MESVTLETLPEDPADIYIPTIAESHSAAAAAASTTGSESSSQAVQLPTIRYTPAASSSVIPPPLLAASRTIVADATPILQGIHYRTTFCTQVQFAQTFHYPPTPPLEGLSSDVEKHGHMEQQMEHLAIAQAPLDYDGGHEKPPVNSFPSLPTPPDIEALHASQQQANQAMEQQQQHHHLSEADTTTHSPSPYSKPLSASLWPPQHTAAQAAAPNICFMPAQSHASSHASVIPYSNGAVHGPPGLQPATAIYYPMATNGMNGSPFKKMPPLLKDGEWLCAHMCILMISCT